MKLTNLLKLILSICLLFFIMANAQVMKNNIDPTTGLPATINESPQGNVPLSTSGGNVLWDLTHGVNLGYEPANQYTNLVSALQGAGYTVNTTTDFPNVNLSTYKVLVINLFSAFNSAYTSSEITKIRNFVQNGGGLLIMGDNANVAHPHGNINPIIQPYGITLGISDISPLDLYVTNFISHAIFTGVSQLYFRSAGEITVTSPGTMAARAPDNKGIVGVAQSGSGRVVAVGDINFCANAYLATSNNQKFSINAFDWLSAGTPTGPVYIKDFTQFPAYPYNTSSYMQGGAYVGCGPTSGAMILGYYQHVNSLPSATGLLTNPVTGVNEGLNTAWALHGSAYMKTGADGFGSVYDIEPGLENYATNRGYKMNVLIHVSPTYSPSSTAWSAYGPYGTSWVNDGDFWTYIGGVWNIDASKFCDFVGVKLAAGVAIFLTIDTNLDGSGDHWVTLVGYNKSTLKYAFYDTYSSTIQWADIHYCAAPGTKYDNSISLLRSVAYEGSLIPQTNPPQNLLAMNGYHAAIPLAWKPPAGSLVAMDYPEKPGLFGSNITTTQSYIYSSNLAPHEVEFKAEAPRMASWTNAEIAAPNGYNVYRSTSSGGTYTKIASNVQRLYYRDETATNGTHYYYKVTAIYTTGESGFSNVADATAQTDGYVIKSNWASTAPTLDGVINTSEWASAVTTNITYPGYTGTVTLYTMNSASKLYFAVNDGRDHVLHDNDTFGIFFDDNRDRTWPAAALGGEGLFQLYWDANTSSSLNTYMGFYGWWPDNLHGENYTIPPGVAQKISLSSGNIHYEGSIDLTTSDLKALPGNSVGILLYVFEGGTSGFDAAWPQETVVKLPSIVTGYGWCWGPFAYGDIKLAMAPLTVPDITSTVTAWDYGAIAVGGYIEKMFVISNVGTANLNVTATNILGANASEFTIQSGGGAFTLTPSSNRNINVRFTPGSSGSKNATLSISSNDPDENPFLISLTGTGTVPDIASNPASNNYGAVTIGNTVDKTFVLSNVGAANLSVTGTTLTGANASEFSIQSGGGTFAIAPSATRNLVVRFTPVSAGNKSASVSIVSNDPDENPFLINLTGSGTATLPDISVNPTSADFGSVTVGGWQERTVTVKNDGAGTLNVTATTLTGVNASQFTLQSGGGAFSLTTGATRNIVLRFTPTTSGSKTASLSIASNDPDENPLLVNLVGVGAGAGIPILPTITNPMQTVATEFTINIEVGAAGNPVTDLFGVSFKLNYTNTTYVNYVSAEAGPFIGSDVIFFPTADDPNGKVSIGLSRKSGQGGVNGAGSITKIKFTTVISTPNNTAIDFTITDVAANNSVGNPINLTPGVLKITIQSGLLVWPGDTNNNGTVDQADILPLGLHWEKTGPARQSASNMWTGQLASPWAPQAATYADANGDGVINQTDVLPIGLNWGKMHTLHLLASEIPQPRNLEKASAPQLTIKITGDTNPNQDFFIDIIGNNLTNVLGVSFELIYTPVTIADPLSVEIGPENLLGTAPIFFPMVNKTFGVDSGKVSIGISRKFNEGGITGSGLITRIVAHMSAGAIPKVSQTMLTFVNVMANDPTGVPIALEVAPYTLITHIDNSVPEVPPDFVLFDNYPNPFNPGTTISFSCPQPAEVTLTIYDLQGQKVRQLVRGEMPTGQHKTYWNGQDEQGKVVAAGIYFYQIEVKLLSSGQRNVAVKKMTLMK